MENKKKLIFIIIFAVIILLIGSSYALLRSSDVSTNPYTMNVGLLEVSFKSGTQNLTLSNAYPISDEDGMNQQEELVFTIKNTGQMKANYSVYIEETSTSPAFASVIRYANQRNTNGYSDIKTLGEDNYIEKDTFIDINEEVTYRVKMWLDYDADNTYMNKTFSAKLVVVSNQMDENKIIQHILNNNTAELDTSIKFYEVSSSTNGEGLYIMNSTVNNQFPIYYYRGNVTNNNVKFAGYCWKIVRTTDTGGTKMIFAGSPNPETGYCDRTGSDTEIGKSKFNENYKSPAYTGYSNGIVYEYETDTPTENALFGKSVKSDGTLEDPKTTLDSTHHYSFDLTTNGTSDNVRYYYYASGSTYRYITFSKTKTIEDVLEEMLTGNYNTKDHPSTIQAYINDWWKDLDNTYGSYLEDTIWCNDRSISHLGGWNANGGSLTSSVISMIGERRYNTYYSSISLNINQTNTPLLTCSNENDRLSITNGKIKYPLALLTYDESAMAGSIWKTDNKNFYLYNGNIYWLLSHPNFYINQASGGILTERGGIGDFSVNGIHGVRPALSIKAGTEITSGNGSPETPYLIGPQS